MTSISQATADAVDRPHDRVLFLDGWRGWAVGLVLLGHFFPIPGVNPGLLGVEFFFVLSGRLMADILFVKRVPLRTFFPRRLSRVYPALLVFVLVVFAATMFTPWRVGPKAVLQALTFTINYSPWIPGAHGFVDHIWSLCVEEHAYLVLALIVLAARYRAVNAAAIVLAIALFSFVNGFVSMEVFGQDFFQTYFRTDAHIGSIFISVVLFLGLRERLGAVPTWLPGIALLIGLCLNTTAVPIWVSYTLGTSLLAFAVCTFDVAPAWQQAVFRNPVAITIGLYSYSIYLWQQPFFQLKLAGVLNPFAGLALTAVCALASFKLIESPARRLLNEAFERRNVSRQARRIEAIS